MISFQANIPFVSSFDITSPDLRERVDLIERYSALPNVSPVLSGEFSIHWDQEPDEEPPTTIDQSAILSILWEDS